MTGRPARIEGRGRFAALVRTGRRAHRGVVTVHFLRADGEDDLVRVAYSVSRRVGGAVVRNTWRRRLRAIAAELTGELPAGCYLIALAPGVQQLTFQELKDQVGTTMRRASGGPR